MGAVVLRGHPPPLRQLRVGWADAGGQAASPEPGLETISSWVPGPGSCWLQGEKCGMAGAAPRGRSVSEPSEALLAQATKGEGFWELL